MSLLRSQLLRHRVQVGEPTSWGVATPWCGSNPLDGRTACAAHDVASFLDVGGLAQHLTADCRLGWLCHGCGEFHGVVAG